MPSLMLRNFGKRFNIPPLSWRCTKIFLRNARPTRKIIVACNRDEIRKMTFNLPWVTERIAIITLFRFTLRPLVKSNGKVHPIEKIQNRKKQKLVHRINVNSFCNLSFIILHLQKLTDSLSDNLSRWIMIYLISLLS